LAGLFSTTFWIPFSKVVKIRVSCCAMSYQLVVVIVVCCMELYTTCYSEDVRTVRSTTNRMSSANLYRYFLHKYDIKCRCICARVRISIQSPRYVIGYDC
jgi:hypothetical protein